MDPVVTRTTRDLKRHIAAGIITAGPLFITWLLLSFVLGVLASAGLPFIRLLAAALPGTFLHQAWVQYPLAVLLTVTVFYLVGKFTAQVVGREAVVLFEASLEHLPLINKVYTSVRQAIDSLMSKEKSGQRVVLIDFPLAGQKSIGFLTHVLADASTGLPIGAVLVPQAINPSSSFLQFVPMEAITQTDLTMEQAMSMLMTGGAVCPDSIHYFRVEPQESGPVVAESDVLIAVEEPEEGIESGAAEESDRRRVA